MSETRQMARAYFWREEMPCVPGGAVALVLPLWGFLAVDRRSIGYTLGFFAVCLAGTCHR
jgi:hypothetical protein